MLRRIKANIAKGGNTYQFNIVKFVMPVLQRFNQVYRRGRTTVNKNTVTRFYVFQSLFGAYVGCIKHNFKN